MYIKNIKVGASMTLGATIFEGSNHEYDETIG